VRIAVKIVIGKQIDKIGAPTVKIALKILINFFPKLNFTML